MVNKMSLQESILNAVNIMVEQRTNDLKVDKTITAVIEKNMGTFNGKTLYRLLYQGGFFEAVVLNDEIYFPHTSVYVLIPQGDFSKQKIIIGRANNINLGKESSLIASAINQYTLIGSNLLYNAKKDDKKLVSDLQYGVYSYHDLKEEEINPNSILHRYNLICSYNLDNNDYEESFERKDLNITNTAIYNQNIAFNKENLNILKEQATGLMLRADFKTNLTTEQRQQAKGEYGLILNLVFDNLNKDYGATNGEVFEKISDMIIGESYISRAQAINFNCDLENKSEESYDYYLIKLKDVHNFYINQIKEHNNADADVDIKNNIRLLIEYTNNLKTTFSTNNTTKALYTDIVNNTLTAYLSFLNELELSNTVKNFNEIYNDWWTQNIGDTEDKIISYKFSSNNMIGNPLSFNDWNSQYQILDVDIQNLIRIDSIILYKQGFIEDTNSESNWPLNNSGPDIFVKNLQLYPIKPLDNENGDYTLKVQPKNIEDPNAGILTGTDSTDVVAFEAILMRKMIENLSKGTRVAYYWFKEDFSVIDVNSPGYDVMAGTGWKRTSSGKGYNFIASGNNNLAYKNNYKCVARYTENNDNIIVLSTIFTVYNNAIKTNIMLESNLGTIFSFDAGIPEITCRINENLNDSDEIDDYQEIIAIDNETYPKYRYYWAITDAANGTKIFLNNIDNKSTNDIQDILNYVTAETIADNIEYYKINENLEKISTENSIEATRIKYPVNKLSSGFTVECFVKKKVSILGSNRIRYIDAGSAALEFLNKGLDIDLNTFKLVIENGNQVFQYDEYGNSPNNINKKEPLDILPLQAKVFAPSGVEIKNNNYSVEWIFPTENTMIVAGEALENNSSTGVPQLHKGLSCNFDIINLYNPDYWNNQITCHVKYNNQDLYKDTEFTFTKIGENGTNGTDVVAKIYYTGNDILNTLHNEPLTIYIQDNVNENNIKTSKAMFNVPNGNNRMKELLEDLPIMDIQNDKENNKKNNGILNVGLYQKSNLISEEDYAATYPRWTLLGNSSYSKSYGKYLSIIKNENSYAIHWNGSVNNERKELYQIIKAEVQLKTGQIYYATYNIPFIWYFNQNIVTKDHLLAIDRGSYLSSVLYNADGRNPIYNHNQGLKFINIPSNITKIVWKAKGGMGDSPCFNFILEDGKTLETLYEKTENINSEEMINILPNDIYDGGITNNYIETSFYDNEDNLIIIAYVPIYMSLNTFGLASLNAWDGNHVTVNEDEGYIMSPQIGAGEKDENNRFTGILMGKTEGEVGHTGQTDSQTGLFGYTHGIQSIFLDAKTGNATFGLPNGLHLDENNNLKETNNFNEGRIELRPGGESTIGGWTLGNRSLYYTSKKIRDTDKNGKSVDKWVHSGELEKRDKPDYVPNWKTGLIEKDISYSYSKHHEKDIRYDQSGILLYAGENPYISIKGRPFTEEDIPKSSTTKDSEKESFIKPEDSIELQLDPATPTLFTIFRHNGGNREGIEGIEGEDYQYETGSRTFLAGINSQGEFISNGLRNANTTDITIPKGVANKETWKAGSLITKFAVNTLNAFDDFEDDVPKNTHVGFEITANQENTLAHFFTKINGLKINRTNEITNYYDPTLHISGGYSDYRGEYSRPLALHGKDIQMYALDGTVRNNNNNHKFLSKTDAGLKISTDEAKLQLGPSTYFNLFRDTNSNNIHNTLMTTNGLKINVGQENPTTYTIEEVKIGNKWTSLDNELEYNKYKEIKTNQSYVLDESPASDESSSSNKVKKPTLSKYINLIQAKNIYEKINSGDELDRFYIDPTTLEYSIMTSTDLYYKNNNKVDDDKYVLVNSYNNHTYYKNKNNDIIEKTNIFRSDYLTQISLNTQITNENSSDYYIQQIITAEENAAKNDLYISEEDLNNNMFYYTENNYIQIDGNDNIYYKRQNIDENNSTIFINANEIGDEENPFIIVEHEKDDYGVINIQHYWKNEFDWNNLYFQINIDNNSYYVTDFALKIYEKLINDMGEEEWIYQSDKDIVFSANSLVSLENWNREYYEAWSNNDSRFKYTIVPSFNDEDRPEENKEEFDIIDENTVDFTKENDFDEYGALNFYRKYIGEIKDGMHQYILQHIVDGAKSYYYYSYSNSDNPTNWYSISDNEERNKTYYKKKNIEDFIEIKNENQLYYRNNNTYILLNEDFFDVDNFYYLKNDNTYEIINDNIDKESIKLYRCISSEIDYNTIYFNWISLKDWIEGSQLIEYCKLTDDNTYWPKNNFSTNQKYMKINDSSFIAVTKGNFNYIYLEDNRSTENFFITIDDFNKIYNDKTNRYLLVNDKDFINIGVLSWDKKFKNGIKNNKNTNLRQRKISTSYSNKPYSIYSGTYKNYIQKNNNYITKIDIDDNIKITNTRLINFYSNKNFDMVLSSSSNIDTISKIGEIYLGATLSKAEYGDKPVYGKFVHINNTHNYGLILTSDTTHLIGEERSNIKSNKTITITASNKGSLAQYNEVTPQIQLSAGNQVKLILNSDKNRWNTTFKKPNYTADKFGDKELLEYPVSILKTSYSNISIIPRYRFYRDTKEKTVKTLYHEFLNVEMDQTITDGLEIQGKYKNNTKSIGLYVANNIQANKYIGRDWNSFYDFNLSKDEQKKDKEGDLKSKTFGSGGTRSPGVGGSATFYIPSIIIQKNTGRPTIKSQAITIKMPGAYSIWSSIKKYVDSEISSKLSGATSKFLTTKTASDTYVTKTTYNNHTHKATYRLIAPPTGGPIGGQITINKP